MGGCAGRDLLLFDPFRFQQRGRLLLDYRPALLEERITGIRSLEPRGVHFHLVTHSADDWFLMALGTRISVEQWAETIFRFEDALEDFLPLLKLRPLRPREVRQRLSQFGLLQRLAAHRQQAQNKRTHSSPRFHRLFPFESQKFLLCRLLN